MSKKESNCHVACAVFYQILELRNTAQATSAMLMSVYKLQITCGTAGFTVVSYFWLTNEI